MKKTWAACCFCWNSSGVCSAFKTWGRQFISFLGYVANALFFFFKVNAFCNNGVTKKLEPYGLGVFGWNRLECWSTIPTQLLSFSSTSESKDLPDNSTSPPASVGWACTCLIKHTNTLSAGLWYCQGSSKATVAARNKMSSTIKGSRGNTMKCLQQRFNKYTLVCSCRAWKISKEIPINFPIFLVKYYFIDEHFTIRQTSLIVSMQIMQCNIY